VSGEYQKTGPIFAKDRRFPFNTQDLSSICNSDGSCMLNTNLNGISESGFYNGNFSIPGVTWVRPVSAANPLTGAGQWSFLNPAAGCREWPEVHPANVGSVPILNGVPTSCEVNTLGAYGLIQPSIKRHGVSARATFRPDDNNELFVEGNAYWTDTFASFTPLGFNGTPTQPIPLSLVAYNVMLPVLVCPTAHGTPSGAGTGCVAGAPGTILDPYNPFAANGQTAQAFLRSTRPRSVETKGRALRGVIGASGTFFDDWHYNASVTASEFKLRRLQAGYLIPQRIMDVVARGEFNFANPEATPENIWDFNSPVSDVVSSSNLWQANVTISRDLFALPGGNLAAAVGASYRHEGVDSPSANPPLVDENGLPDPNANQYTRYLSLNAVGTQGSRNVKSAYFELDAPFFDIRQNGFGAEVNVSGRYDKYSTGQSNFSPKVGVKITPIRELALRGTWSKGFRIPSFQESFGLPTTGFVTRTISCGTKGIVSTAPAGFAAFCAAHATSNPAVNGGQLTANAYATGAFPEGLTNIGNPNLEPEKSTNLTAGLIFEPIKNLSFTVDLWKIKIKNLIIGTTPSQQAAAFAQYYANNGVVNVPGVSAVLPGVPDPAFPLALPQLGFIAGPFQNANSETVSGVDLGANFQHRFGGVRWTSNIEASYLHRYVLNDAGTKIHYEGTLSPCNITSCSGAPRWRGSWQNTVEFGGTTLSATAYYTSGYGNESTDFGATKGDCQSGIDNGSVATFEDGTAVACRAKAIWNVDVTAAQKITDSVTIYANVLNVFDIDAPFDHAAAYSLFNFQPAWAGPNIVGRYFRIGAKFDLNPRERPAPIIEAAPPPPPPPPPPASRSCPDGSVSLATDACPAPPPPPPPPPPAPERGY
jgi:iron complex outermembrane receptor protein